MTSADNGYRHMALLRSLILNARSLQAVRPRATYFCGEMALQHLLWREGFDGQQARIYAHRSAGRWHDSGQIGWGGAAALDARGQSRP